MYKELLFQYKVFYSSKIVCVLFNIIMTIIIVFARLMRIDKSMKVHCLINKH